MARVSNPVLLMNYTGLLSVRLRVCSPATVTVLIGFLVSYCIVLQRICLEDSLNNKPPPLPSHTSHMHVNHVRNKNSSTELIFLKKHIYRCTKKSLQMSKRIKWD